jgi:phosphoglycolate phosphatase-like HAD superfamily hydrolase
MTRHVVFDMARTTVFDGEAVVRCLREALADVGCPDVPDAAIHAVRPADLAEGMAAGCGIVAGFTGGSDTRVELAARPHTHRLDRLPDLLEILDGRLARSGASDGTHH